MKKKFFDDVRNKKITARAIDKKTGKWTTLKESGLRGREFDKIIIDEAINFRSENILEILLQELRRFERGEDTELTKKEIFEYLSCYTS